MQAVCSRGHVLPTDKRVGLEGDDANGHLVYTSLLLSAYHVLPNQRVHVLDAAAARRRLPCVVVQVVEHFILVAVSVATLVRPLGKIRQFWAHCHSPQRGLGLLAVFA